MSNTGTIATLTNSGAISGGNGGTLAVATQDGGGGAGVSNAGTITTLTNSGTISGGAASAGVRPRGRAARGRPTPTRSRR